MSPIYLVARRDYLAFVGAWGFWLSLFAAPAIIALLLFGPVLLARAEPPRVLVILADQPGDLALVTRTFADEARQDARDEIDAYVSGVAFAASAEVMAAFDRAPDSAHAIAAARAVVADKAPTALRGFPRAWPRYLIAQTPTPTMEGLKPYLTGVRSVSIEGAPQRVFGALNIRRDTDGPAIDYWSVNLQHVEPSNIAARAMRLQMRREALTG